MTANVNSQAIFMSARNVAKSFGNIEVLRDINLEIHAGEVHVLLGENGAGKSTLVKILAGFEALSAGQLLLPTDATEKNSRADQNWNNEIAEQAGVVLIHQEFNLAEQLSVVENIFLGAELKRGLFLDKQRMSRLAREYLLALDCDLDPDTGVEKLSVSAKQMVEIARARAKHARLLILDEPTAVLTNKESEVLFQLIERLKQQGVAIVYISHKLDEIERLADKITILRDGEMVGCYAGGSLSQDEMARLMVGRELTKLFPVIPPPPDDDPVLTVSNVSVAGRVKNVGFSLNRGEVLGFAGLVGSGRSALLEAIIGLCKTSGPASIEFNGKSIDFPNLATARRHGIVYLTKDRKGQGLLLNKGLTFNFSLFSLHKFSRGIIDSRLEQQAFAKAVSTFDIRIKDTSVNAESLSGGNQQKLLLAKVLETEPEIIIIDEPTRGIDIGTKSQIYHFIAELVAKGLSVVLISSDIMEIIGLSHRVAVMRNGELTGILSGDEIEEHEIMRYATGLKNKNTMNDSIHQHNDNQGQAHA